MKIIEHKLNGVIEITPSVFGDDRGYFFESFNIQKLEEFMPCNFVQDNESFSTAGVVRGLHFQKPPFAQAKLVRVVKGRVLDVAVDLRRSSPTYGEHVAVELNTEKHNQLYIPEGFAHGFSVLEDCIFQYKCSNYYHKESEGGIMFNDPDLNIDWKVDTELISDKDKELSNLRTLENVFE